MEQINASPAYVLSVDINSGMNGDSGEGVCVRSDCTVSIGTLKYGHILGLLAGKIGLLLQLRHRHSLPWRILTAASLRIPLYAIFHRQILC